MAISLRAGRRLGVLAVVLTAGGALTVNPGAGRAAAPCASHTGRSGSITVCPGAGPVGTLVTIRGDLTCGQSVDLPAPVVFLGPGDTVASGGTPVRTRIETSAFEGFFRIPLTYTSARGATLATAPGPRYAFATEPGGRCAVPFGVLAPPASHARLWRPPGVSGLTCGRPRTGGGLLCETSSGTAKRGHRAWQLGARGRAAARTVRGWPFAVPAARAVTLPAGTHWSSGALRCTAGARAVTCENASGHGFVVGPGGHRRF
jgi:hypothetical protein